jgi:thymidylate synthase (FAD)
MMGMDLFPATAARVSFNNDLGTSTPEKDTKLIKYLADHDHLTPFEYQHATLMIECPLFIRSQIHRHRTFSFNEISRRYTDEDIEFWVPTTFRKQSESNRQASDGVFVDGAAQGFHNSYLSNHIVIEGIYQSYIEAGIAREQARAILPQSLLTRFYMGGNLRNWAHFLELRQDAHAQYEVQVIANKVRGILYDLWPTSLKALIK